MKNILLCRFLLAGDDKGLGTEITNASLEAQVFKATKYLRDKFAAAIYGQTASPSR